MKKQYIQVRIKTVYKHSNIYSNFIKTILGKLGIQSNIIYLPRKVKRITLLKSPHVNKKAREQFEVITYKTLINIYTKTINTELFKLLLLNKPKYMKLNIRKII